MNKYQVPMTLHERLKEARQERILKRKLWRAISLMAIMVVILLMYMGYQLVVLAELLKQL